MAAREPVRVVVGVAESLAGLAALRFAVAQARLAGVPLHAVRAWAFSPPWRDSATRRWRSEIAGEADQAIQAAFAAALGGPPNDVEIQQVTNEGFAGKVLVEYACREDDLLVVGGHGHRSRLARTVGPVTRYCLRQAHCPVVVVSGPEWARAASTRHLARQVGRDLRRLS